MTGCALCGMKGPRTCRVCAGGRSMPAIEAMAARAKAAPMTFGVDRTAVPFRFSPDYVPEPEPVELTVEDVLGVLAKMEREARGCCPLSWRSDDDWRLSRQAKWTLVRFEGRYRALGPRADDATEFGTLRDVLIEAKKRGLL